MMVNHRRIGSLFLTLSLSCSMIAASMGPQNTAGAISEAAARRCTLKLRSLEEFAIKRNPNMRQKTKFSEEEVNSYLLLEGSSQFHPCLKSLVLTFEENRLQGIAAIDFDLLGNTSNKFFAGLISTIFSGSHELTVHGQLQSNNGKAHFKLEQARFDGMELPKLLVEEIISAVGRSQNPPFDPLQPSEMPYDIKRVVVHSGHIIVFQ